MMGSFGLGVSEVYGSPEYGEARARVLGSSERMLGNYRVRRPISSDKLLGALEVISLPEIPGRLEGIFQFLGRDDMFVRDYCNHRKVVEHAEFGEKPRYTVVAKIPGLTNDDLADYGDDVDSRPSVHEPLVVVKSEEKKTYSLQMLFSDTDVQARLGLSARVLQSVRRMAAFDPRKAAEEAQVRVRASGFPNFEVIQGGYAKSKGQAAWRIRAAAAKLAHNCETVSSMVIAQQMFMYRVDGQNTALWTVSGPLEYAREMRAAYDLAVTIGAQEAMFLLGIDLGVLKIEIYNESSGTYYVPTIIGHASSEGIEPLGYGIPEGLTAEQQVGLRRWSEKVLPVLNGDKVVGSAVRVSEKYMLVNAHTLEVEVDDEDMILTIAGDSFLQKLLLSKDLWVVEMVGESTAWSLREPRVGERVVLCYSTGLGAVEYSSPVCVESFDTTNFSVQTPKQARPGSSGAAVIAVSDMSLLGVYSGHTRYSSVCAAFTPHHFSAMVDLETASTTASTAQSLAGVGEAVIAKFKQRGLGGVFKSVVDSLTPLMVEDQFVGCAARFGARLVTSVDPNGGQLRLQDGKPLVFDNLDDGRYYVLRGNATKTQVRYNRRVEPDERVVVVGRQAACPFSSRPVRVSNVGVSGSIFSLPDFGESLCPFDGALVVAERDAAVVGQFVRRDVDVRGNFVSLCAGIPAAPAVAEGEPTLSEVISAKFPFLNLVTWPMPTVERVFTHGSIQKSDAILDYACIGDSVASTVLWQSLMEAGVAHSGWAIIRSRMHSNARMASISESCGLAAMLRVLPGVNLPAGCKPHADILEALIGLAHEYESFDTVVELCRALELVYEPPTPTTITRFDETGVFFPEITDTHLSRAGARSVSPAGTVVSRPRSELRVGSPQRASWNVFPKPRVEEVTSMRRALDEMATKLNNWSSATGFSDPG